MISILVTGGCGFIGSNFIRKLLFQDESVSIINLDKLTYSGNINNLKDIIGKKYKTIKKRIIRNHNFKPGIFGNREIMC